MKLERKRRITAQWLLSIFVSMTLFASLHQHQPVANPAADCAECAHHLHHGHLTTATTSLHDCVLCQFLSIPFVPATTLAVGLPVSLTRKGQFYLCDETAQAEPSFRNTRAPPYYI